MRYGYCRAVQSYVKVVGAQKWYRFHLKGERKSQEGYLEHLKGEVESRGGSRDPF
jgi:hypothetical protein